jgi:erythromycin esterase-like protein
VSASDAWGAPVERKRLPEAREESWEDVLHRLGHDSLVMLSGAHAPAALLEPRGHRAIGVVYHPEHEHADDYVPTVLPLRYDALLFCDSTHALESLPRDEPEPTWKSAQAHETAQCRDGAASAPARLESV